MYRSTKPVRELGAVDADAEAIGHLGEGRWGSCGYRRRNGNCRILHVFPRRMHSLPKYMVSPAKTLVRDTESEIETHVDRIARLRPDRLGPPRPGPGYIS